MYTDYFYPLNEEDREKERSKSMYASQQASQPAQPLPCHPHCSASSSDPLFVNTFHLHLRHGFLLHTTCTLRLHHIFPWFCNTLFLTSLMLSTLTLKSYYLFAIRSITVQLSNISTLSNIIIFCRSDHTAKVRVKSMFFSYFDDYHW